MPPPGAFGHWVASRERGEPRWDSAAALLPSIPPCSHPSPPRCRSSAVGWPHTKGRGCRGLFSPRVLRKGWRGAGVGRGRLPACRQHAVWLQPTCLEHLRGISALVTPPQPQVLPGAPFPVPEHHPLASQDRAVVRSGCPCWGEQGAEPLGWLEGTLVSSVWLPCTWRCCWQSCAGLQSLTPGICRTGIFPGGCRTARAPRVPEHGLSVCAKGSGLSFSLLPLLPPRTLKMCQEPEKGLGTFGLGGGWKAEGEGCEVAAGAGAGQTCPAPPARCDHPVSFHAGHTCRT